jgi:hypothetical protein
MILLELPIKALYWTTILNGLSAAPLSSAFNALGSLTWQAPAQE